MKYLPAMALLIFQGKDPVTVRSGEIPPDGRVALTMPETYQDYRGMPRSGPRPVQVLRISSSRPVTWMPTLFLLDREGLENI